MKRVFWLMSAVGLTVAQSSTAQSTVYSSNGVQYVNVSSQNTNIDDEINRLISSNTPSSFSTTTRTTTYSYGAAQQTQLSAQPSLTAQLTKSSAPSVAAGIASRAAHGKSIGRCALYVRKALQAAGYEFTPKASAYMYAHGTLSDAGFTKISSDNYVPQVGDVVVFNRTSRNPHGHIQIYDGNQWVSDFRQPNFSPYRNHNGYSVWRDTRYIDASANTGTHLALNGQ